MTELEFAKKFRDAGGTAYLVGGAVRDKFRNVETHDRDYCVTGIDEKFSDFPCNVDANCQIRRLKISARRFFLRQLKFSRHGRKIFHATSVGGLFVTKGFTMTELEFAKKIRDAGGTAYLVGGAVRDKFRNVEAHDRDYCITGIDEKIFTGLFPDAEKFGKSFPVYSIEIDGKHCEVAFARTEKKFGTGYRGFEILFAPTVTIEQDLFRRDTTINAMAIEILSGELVDPFGGREDVLNKKIRAVSKHFTDDPVRALRAARQAAQFGFEISAETIDAMKLCGEELADEPTERIFDELATALKTDVPSIFFRSLERADLLAIIFPEIANLRGKIQPTAFHPEGDAYEHTLNLLDAVSKVNPKPIVRFAALMHDIGKGATPPEMLPHHYKHELRGLDVLKRMSQRMVLPGDWKKTAAFVIHEHMRAPQLKHAGKIVDLLLSIGALKISVRDFCDIINADNHGLPPYLEHAQEIISELMKIGGRHAPPELKGTAVGKWIHDERIRRFVALKKFFREEDKN